MVDERGRVAREGAWVLKAMATWMVAGIHEAWLLPVLLGVRMLLVGVVVVVMVLSAEKSQRVEAIKSVPGVADALLGRHHP